MYFTIQSAQIAHYILAISLFSIMDLTPQDALQFYGDQEVLFLDVREEYEYEAGHIPGSWLMPFSSGVLQEKYTELPKDKLILVYCRSGNRSARAVQFLEEQGFSRLGNILGGFNAYANEANAPIEIGPYLTPITSNIAYWMLFQ